MKLSLPVKPKSIKQAALMADYCLLYYDRAFFLVDKPPDMACQMSYSTSAKVGQLLLRRMSGIYVHLVRKV